MLYTNDRRSLSTIDHSFPHPVIVQYVFMVGVLSVLCTVDNLLFILLFFLPGAVSGFSLMIFDTWSIVLWLIGAVCAC